MDIKELKKRTRELDSVPQLVKQFEKHFVKTIGKSKHAYPFLQELSKDRIRGINKQLKDFRGFLNEVEYAQTVNDKLASLAHNLFDLKLALLLNDHKKAKRIVTTFLRDPQSSMKRLIDDVSFVDTQLSLLHNSYHTFLEGLSEELKLEHAVILLDGKHKSALQNLIRVSNTQKTYVKHLGKHFVDIARELKKNKEFRGHIKL